MHQAKEIQLTSVEYQSIKEFVYVLIIRLDGLASTS